MVENISKKLYKVNIDKFKSRWTYFCVETAFSSVLTLAIIVIRSTFVALTFFVITCIQVSRFENLYSFLPFLAKHKCRLQFVSFVLGKYTNTLLIFLCLRF